MAGRSHLGGGIRLISGQKVGGVMKARQFIENVEGRVAAPVLMYFLGVPGFVCILAWLFFFRGR